MLPGVQRKRMNKLLSGIARVNYNFADRYLLTATFRADGSSKFDKDHRFGYFPSFSAAWRISNEEFMKRLTALSNMKLRVGYGETGNQDIGNNSYQNLLKKGYEYVFGNSPVTTIIPGNARESSVDVGNSQTVQCRFGYGFL